MILNQRRETHPLEARGRPPRITRPELKAFYRDLIGYHGPADHSEGTPHGLADALVATLNRYAALHPGMTLEQSRAAMGLAWRRKCSGPGA